MSVQRCRLMLLVLLSAALLSNCFTIGGPARTLALVASRTPKIPRSIRAPYSNPQMMTARGWGKRSHPAGQFKELNDAPWSLSKSSDEKFYNDLVADGDSLGDINDSSVDRFPIEWLVRELVRNPTVVESILRRFVDANHDGFVTAQEILQQQPSASTKGPTSSLSSTLSDEAEVY